MCSKVIAFNQKIKLKITDKLCVNIQLNQNKLNSINNYILFKNINSYN